MEKIKSLYKKYGCISIDILWALSFIMLIGFLALKKIFDFSGHQFSFLDNNTLTVMSIFANMCIVKLVQAVLSVSNIKLKREHWISIGTVFAILLAFYICLINYKDFLYYWDFSNYYVRQFDLEDSFIFGFPNGMAYFLASLKEDYTSFINLFTQFPFCFTSRTADSYVICQLFNILLPVLVLLGGLTVKFSDVLNAKNKKLFFYLAFAAAATVPVLHNAATFGQPDFYGIIFCLAIILLTIDYDFKKIDIVRFILIFVSTALLVVTRRWYLYFMVGYYFVYAVAVLVNSIINIKKHDKKDGIAKIKNLLIFGISCAVLMFLAFKDMIIHILTYDYGDRYASYMYGGFPMEVATQIAILGIMGVIMLFGIGYAIVKKYNLKYIAMAIFGWLITLLLFTRVQNLGLHHQLILLPYYFMLIFVGIAAVLNIKKKNLYKAMLGCVIAVIMLQPFLSYSRCSVYYYDLYRAIPEPQADKAAVTEVSQWIEDNCEDEEKAYIMPHSIKYNPDIFKNVILPDRGLFDNIPFGFDVFGTHKFPVDIFESKYVITADPFPNFGNESGLSKKLNDVFMSIADEKYKLVKTFDMSDGCTFYAYERTQAADIEEIEIYEKAFKEESEKYPDLFKDVIDEYVKNKGF